MKKILITIGIGIFIAVALLLFFSSQQAQANGLDAYFTSFWPGESISGTGGCTVTGKYHAYCEWNAPSGDWQKFGDGTSAPRLIMTSTGYISSVTFLYSGDNCPAGSYYHSEYDPAGQVVYPGGDKYGMPADTEYTFYCEQPWACYTEYFRFYKWVKPNSEPAQTYEWDIWITRVNGNPVGEEIESACANDDPTLQDSAQWTDIVSPTWLSGTGGVLLDYGDGVAQSISLAESGYYDLDISATLPISFPLEQSGIRACLGEGCAVLTPIVTDTTTSAVFNVLQSGNYDLSVVNLSSSRLWPTDTITVTYICLTAIDNSCIVLDPELNNVRLPVFAGEQGWYTVYDGVNARPGGALLNCDQAVYQWVWLDAGAYTMTLHAQGDFFILHTGLGTTTNISGLLAVRVAYEGDPNEYDLYGVAIHHVDSDELGQVGHNRVYSLTFEAPESGNYLLSFINWGCKRSVFEFVDGRIWLDYVCLGDTSAASTRLGYCSTLVDAAFQEYNARRWGKVGDVDWTPGYVSLAPQAAITQTVDISSTPSITELVAYVVARAEPETGLQVSVGGISHTFTISEALSEFKIYSVTLSSLSLSATYQVEAITNPVEIDFTCLYRVGEVPIGDWYNGADGDTECIEPLPFAWEGLSLKSVQAVLKYIWEWIVYLVCLMVLWLRRIWLAIGNMIQEWVVDLGLDQFWLQFRLWLRQLWQGPYDWLKIAEYVLDLVLTLAGQFFALVGRGFGSVFNLFGLILVGLQFLGALLAAFWTAMQTPCDPLSLSVPVPIVQGFLLTLEVLEELTIIEYIEWLVIGLMGVSMVVWTLSQFRSFSGGGEGA